MLHAQANNRWQKLPPKLKGVLRDYFKGNRHWPLRYDLDNVRFATRIQTLHGLAITFENNIFFPRDINLESRADVRLMIHELEHTMQYAARGGLGPFIANYIVNSTEATAQVIAEGRIDFTRIRSLHQLEVDATNKSNRIINSVMAALKTAPTPPVVKWRLRVVDTNVERLQRGQQSSVGGSLATDGTYLYWWDNRPGSLCIRRSKFKSDYTLEQSMVVEQPPSSINPRHGITTDGRHLYWWDTRSSFQSIRRADIRSDGSLGGSTEVEASLHSSVDASRGLAHHGGFLYWWDTRSNYRSVRRAKINDQGTLDGSMVVEIPPSGIEGCLAASNNHLFWWDNRSSYNSLRTAKILSDGKLGLSEEVEQPPSSIDISKGLAVTRGSFFFVDTRTNRLVRAEVHQTIDDELVWGGPELSK